MTELSPWNFLVEAARARVEKAHAGDAAAARELLTNCAAAIRAVVHRGVAPDPERTVCLEFLSEALDRIVAGTDARKALGVYERE